MATGDRELAAYLLCHDMHEAYLGDDTTPKKRALSAIMSKFGVLASTISESFELLTNRIDTVIHDRAGLQWPPPSNLENEIHKWDRVLLATEWRDLMPFPQPYAFGQAAIPDKVLPHANWQTAAGEMLELCTSLLPGGGR